MQIGSWVLHTALEQAERWRRAGIAIPVSVNVSARELTELDLAERVREELAYCRLPGHALCIEVSEEAVRRDPERAREALRDVRRLGVSIALDKFGAGGLSFGLPSDIPFDVVKLDRVLTTSFDRDKERRALFAATIALAKEAGLTAVAVGIETNRQLALARQLDCSVGQGFLLQGPTAAGDAAPQGPGRGCNVRAMASPGATGRPGEPSLSAADPAAEQKRAAAEAAAELIEDGMKLGLGTGSTVAYLLPAIARRGLSGLRCAATSPATEQAALELGIDVEPLDALGELDLAIDGADQVDPAGWLIKGGGGAHTREKIVAAAARRFVVIVSAEKPVPALTGAGAARAARVRRRAHARAARARARCGRRRRAPTAG